MELGWVDTPQDWRDVFIMAYMVAGTLLRAQGERATFAVVPPML